MSATPTDERHRSRSSEDDEGEASSGGPSGRLRGALAALGRRLRGVLERLSPAPDGEDVPTPSAPGSESADRPPERDGGAEGAATVKPTGGDASDDGATTEREGERRRGDATGASDGATTEPAVGTLPPRERAFVLPAREGEGDNGPELIGVRKGDRLVVSHPEDGEARIASDVWEEAER